MSTEKSCLAKIPANKSTNFAKTFIFYQRCVQNIPLTPTEKDPHLSTTTFSYFQLSANFLHYELILVMGNFTKKGTN